MGPKELLMLGACVSYIILSLISFQVVCCLENNGCKTPKLVTQAVIVLPRVLGPNTY